MRQLLQSLVLFSLMALIPQACGQADAKKNDKANQAEKVIPVKIQDLKSSAKSLPILSSGVLNAKTERNLSFKIGGIIQRIYVEEGQTVYTGQLLAQLEQAEISAQVNQSKTGLDKAQRDLKRAQTLYKDTVATLEQVQNAQTAVDMAKANDRIARFNQKYSAIYAPGPGKVLSKMKESQELVNPGTPILRIASTAQAQVIRVGISDRDIVKLKLGDQAQITFDAYPGENFQARITEIAEIADPRTGTFEVELSLAPSQKVLKSGFVAKVALFPSSGEAYYKVPLGALVEADKNQAYVYVPNEKNGTATKKLVNVLSISNSYFTIRKSELKDAKSIVIDGAPYLSNGSKIKY